MRLPLTRAQKRVEHDLNVVDQEISNTEGKMEECNKAMKDLKVVLYAKFGSAINLDE